MTIFVNKEKVETFNFSGGECHVRITQDISKQRIGDATEIVAYLYSSDDVMCLLLTVNAVRKINADTEIYLTVPYFPYARQDRVCFHGEAFSLEVMAGLINSLECKTVTVLDPHSKVTPKLLKNCVVVSQAGLIQNTEVETVIKQEKLILLAPDEGAREKTEELAKNLGVEAQYARKVRNPDTGGIMGTEIPDNVEGKKYMVVDDICDGGRTFIELGKLLKQNGASDLYLYMTHGIFSKGLDELQKYYKHVYCYHSMNENYKNSQEFLTILEGEVR